jgi:hypothetical protein
MFITTHASPAIAKRNLSRSISISCFVFVFIANMNAGPANARFLTSLTATEAIFSENIFDYQILDNECAFFAYRQRAIINGQTVMVLTEYVYPAGKQQMTLIGTCDGLNFYEAGTCSCFNTKFRKFEFFPIIELGTPPNKDVEKVSKKSFKAEF